MPGKTGAEREARIYGGERKRGEEGLTPTIRSQNNAEAKTTPTALGRWEEKKADDDAGAMDQKKMKKENADGKSYVTKLLLFFFLRRRCRTLTRSGIATAEKNKKGILSLICGVCFRVQT